MKKRAISLGLALMMVCALMVTTATALQELKSKGDEETIVRWSEETVNDYILALSGDAISRTPGTYYRTGVTSTVYNANGVGETITVYSPWVKCP